MVTWQMACYDGYAGSGIGFRDIEKQTIKERDGPTAQLGEKNASPLNRSGNCPNVEKKSD